MDALYEKLCAGYTGRSCLVTGHTGFKGSWLTLVLQRLGARVTGCALDPEHDLFDSLEFDDSLSDRRADLRDLGVVRQVVEDAQPELVFHLAAQSLVRRSYEQPKLTFDTNVGGTVNLLDVLRDMDSVRAVVVVTSDKVYENREWIYGYRELDDLGGHDPYSCSKTSMEMVASAYRGFFSARGVGLATARAGNVIGGGDWAPDAIVPDIARALRAGIPVEVRNPGATRPWQHVLEPLSGYLCLAQSLLATYGDAAAVEAHAGPWNFGPEIDSCVPVRELVEGLFAAYGAGEWLDRSARQESAPYEAQLLSLSSEKARARLGWRPRWDLSQTLARTAVWYRRFAAGEPARELCRQDIEAYWGSS